jgi:uncharacterized membrane protein
MGWCPPRGTRCARVISTRSREASRHRAGTQSINLVGIGAASGGLSGALWGSVVGLLFLNPLAGMAVGGLIAAGSGALSGRLVDYSIEDDFIRRIRETLQPNTSALFVLVRKAQPEKVLSECRAFAVA